MEAAEDYAVVKAQEVARKGAQRAGAADPQLLVRKKEIVTRTAGDGNDFFVETRIEVRAVKENKPDIIGMSALLTTTMLAMKEIIELLKEEGLRNQVKVIIGGAPISQDFADEIGADGFAPDAGSTTELCQKLIAC